jgi:hypothetical protein
MHYKSVLIFIACVILTKCAPVHAPKGTIPKYRDAETNVYGSWMLVNYHDDAVSEELKSEAGELISIQDSNLYLLYLDSIMILEIKNISNAVLATHKYGGPQFLIWGGGSTLPNIMGMLIHGDYAGEFAIMGALQIYPAGIATLINYLSAHKIQYPKHLPDLESFSIYGRFPQGIPPGVNPDLLFSRPLPQ